MNTQECFEALRDNLTWMENNSGNNIVILKDNSPEWITELIKSVHEERFPSDSIHETINDVVNCWFDTGCITLADLEKELSEIEPEIYTSKLIDWLHDAWNKSLFDDVLERIMKSQNWYYIGKLEEPNKSTRIHIRNISCFDDLARITQRIHNVQVGLKVIEWIHTQNKVTS